MRKQRKREAEERQRQIAQTIRYISWDLFGLSVWARFPSSTFSLSF